MPPRSAIKVIHFVSGGFSGATAVAVELCRPQNTGQRVNATLVLRAKRQTKIERIEALAKDGIQVVRIPGWTRLASVLSLVRLCRREQPEILVCHGYPEHLLGRIAGILGKVPHLVHVEHNSRERYNTLTRWISLKLARRTSAVVGVSDGVAGALRKQGLPEDIVMSIPNGIDVLRFRGLTAPIAHRPYAVIMAARFARQKDQATAIRAIALLKDRGFQLDLTLAGAGGPRHRKTAEKLVHELGIAHLVHFAGHIEDLPSRLGQTRCCLLSSHYEGMPLSLLEGMAAGCVPVGSDVVGIREIVQHGLDGFLFPEGDAQALANILQRITASAGESRVQDIANRARDKAHSRFSRNIMLRAYQSLYESTVATAAPHACPKAP